MDDKRKKVCNILTVKEERHRVKRSMNDLSGTESEDRLGSDSSRRSRERMSGQVHRSSEADLPIEETGDRLH